MGQTTAWRRAGRRRTGRRLAALLGALAVLVPGLTVAVQAATTSPAAAVTDPVIAAAGDIACSPTDPGFNGGAGQPSRCHQVGTSNVMTGRTLAAVLALGDTQYDSGTTAEFNGSYDPSWGRVKALTHPAVGNHEYQTSGATGYYGYFGTAAGDASQGYYSWDLNGWHLIALNSNCTIISCAAGSAQETWLKNDLAAHPSRCTIAYFHHPRFSSGDTGGVSAVGDFWNDLYAAGVELVLVGHDHIYERFDPQTPAAAPDPTRGIRQITVGTGGVNLETVGPLKPNSAVHSTDTFGVLLVTLHPNSYDWQFVNDGSGPFTDSGTGTCQGAPAAPTGVTAAPANASASVSWTAPADTGGLPITGYTVTANPGGTTVPVNGSTTSATVSGLTNGTSYTFTVKATNALGDSPASSPSAAVTPAAVPGAPTGVTAAPGNASASVSWTAPASTGGSAITGYTVTSSPGGITATSTTPSATVTGLTNGTTYTFTVTATNAA
ncbi:MAG TPA: fibronectin type III domain-containing protein, partial [Acidimicrobiales bacterium]|nr:fibronectin type III domain-containing protein [Acidimicrobiales bacterium]